MNSKTQVFKFFLALIICAKLSFAGELNMEVNSALFKQMFGEEYDKVITSKTKIDDEKFAMDLIASATALNSKPEFQIFIKLKAAELITDSDKNKKLARDIFIEINPHLPDLMRREITQKVFDLQRKILLSTPRNNKNVFAEEVEIFVSSAQAISNYNVIESDFSEALAILREALNYVMAIDKDAGNELNKKIQAIQKESNRYSQILNLIDQVKANPKDEKANQALSEYYLFERNNFFMAWPYLENIKNEALRSFFNSLRLCLTDENKLTPDGLSMSIAPLIVSHPKYFLNWLGKSDLVDETGLIKIQIDLLNNNKKIQIDKIESILLATVNAKGNKQDVSFHIYMDLASDISALIDVVTLNKKLESELSKFIISQLITNKYIALSKANLKLTISKQQNEVDKLKMELELGKVQNKMKELEIDDFKVELATPFLLQQKDMLLDKIDVNGGGTYTFDVNNWIQFNKDFEILVDNRVFDPTDKKSLLVQNGLLVFNEKKTYRLNSKKRKWSSNIEVSFEMMKDYEPSKQALDFYILFKPDSIGYKQTFGVFYAFFLTAGWFGVIRDGETWDNFCASKLCKHINHDNADSSIWKTDKIKISAIVKDNKFEIMLNDESHSSYPLSEISKEKGFPNTPIQIYFTKRYGSEVPVKIDNLYIGPPRNIKK